MTNEEKLDKVYEMLIKHKDSLIGILNEIQALYGFLPFDVLKEVSFKTKINMLDMYDEINNSDGKLSMNPKVDYRIGVCLGPKCSFRESEKILEKVQELLGIESGECTEDNKFYLYSQRCMGACEHGPNVKVNEKIYNNVTPNDVKNIIEGLK